LCTLSFLILYLPIQLSEPEISDYDFFVTLNLIITIIFIIDILINLIIEKEDSDGNKIIEFKKIFIHYLTGWFLIDIISTIDISWFIDTNNDIVFGYAKISKLRIIQFLKILRSIKIIRFIKHMNQLGGIFKELLKKKSTTIIVNIFFLLVFCHFFSCLYIASVKIYKDLPDNNWYRMLKGDK